MSNYISNSLLDYENISNTSKEKALRKADKVILEGWSRRGYPIVKLDNIPWCMTDYESRSWSFYIHSWDMLDNLLISYSHSREKKYLNLSLKVALEWACLFPLEKGSESSTMAWYDMAVGLRSYRLAYIIEAAEKADLLDASSRPLLWNTLIEHCEYLSHDSNIVYHNNHGYYQVMGQIAMGRRFSGTSKEMDLALHQGKQRLKYMISQQFKSDGVHVEHSPDYHRMVYETLRSMILSGLIDDRKIIRFSEKIERALSWFVTPQQVIANFGDSDHRSLKAKPKDAERRWSTEAMRYIVTAGKIGKLPEQTVKIFPESGFFIVHEPAIGNSKKFLHGSYLAQIAAFHSRTHKHADDLSFIWCDKGVEILVDAGRYGYIGKAEQGSKLWLEGNWYSDPNRVYCESTRAHNTLEFNGLSSPRKGVKPYGSALHRWTRCTNTRLVTIESECKQFQSIRHARVLCFMPGKWLLVFDWFHDNIGELHLVKQWFHLAVGLTPIKEGNSYSVDIPNSNKKINICSLLSEPKASKTFCGEKEPFMQGWWSGSERECVPNYAWNYELSDVTTGAFATLFSFSDQIQTDNLWSRVNVSGRKGRFRWRDEEGIHELVIDRPIKGEMKVQYHVEN